MSKGRILLVEPDEDVKNMLRIYFGANGYDVSVMVELEKVSGILDTGQFDLLIYGFEYDDWGDKEILRHCFQDKFPHIFLVERSKNPIWREPEIPLPENTLIKPFDIWELKLLVERLLSEEKS